MAAQTTTELERVRYWQGQLLASGDLQTQLRVDEELRRLHNRAVHEAYGIAIGLGSALEPENAIPGNAIGHEVKIENGKLKLPCGMAYDCAGRALIVEEERTIALPPVDDKKKMMMTLVLSYDPTSVDGIALTWKPEQEVNANTGVALTRLTPKVGGADIDPAFRPIVARAMARPRLATGTTIPGETAWQTWKIKDEETGGDKEIGVQVKVDTSSEGFTRVPHYFAEAIAESPTNDFVPAWFASITDPSAQGFTLRLMLRGIARESLNIVDPKVQITKAQTPEGVVEVSQGKLLSQGDHVARLLPIAELASTIKTLSPDTGNATLDVALEEFDTKKTVAFGNIPRLATVTKTPTTRTIEVTVDTPEQFSEGDVVVKLGENPESARPTKIAFMDVEEGILELSTEIVGLKAGDKLGIARQASTVLTVAAKEITVADALPFAVGDVLVRLDNPVETSAPAKIESIKADGTLVLSAVITDLKTGSSLGIAREASTVLNVTSNTGTVKINLDNAKLFREGDVVAKLGTGGSFTSPVRVEHVTPKTLTLSGPIANLAKGDIIGAADFRVRATVLDVKGADVTLATMPPFPVDEEMFPKGAMVARIDYLMSASLPVSVKNSGGATLTLSAEIEDLKRGEVIGLCAFPARVKVESVLGNGRFVVNDGGVLRKSDVVMSPPTLNGIAMVAEVTTGNVVRLVGTIPGLDKGNTLWVTTIQGVIDVSPTGVTTKVIVDQPERLRVGDFLADITGWRQAMPDSFATPFVSQVTDPQLTLTNPLNGLLQNDTVGLASITPRDFRLRSKKLPVLVREDEALIISEDRLQGDTRSMFASVKSVWAAENQVDLTPVGTQAEFRFRPEDISASVLFVRGSALPLIQKQDLFVSWLAIGVSDPMPKPCAGVAVPVCDCTAKE